jgi:hypothetical protein
VALRVPELWRFAPGPVYIAMQQGNDYVGVPESPNFLGLPLRTAIPAYLARSKSEGRNTTLKAFRQWLREGKGTNRVKTDSVG